MRNKPDFLRQYTSAVNIDTIQQNRKTGVTAMGKNAVFERVNPIYIEGVTERDEILVLLEKVIVIMNKGFKNMDTRLQQMERELNGLKELIENMGTYKRI